MHLSLIALMVSVALAWRWCWQAHNSSWLRRWRSAWMAFCLPPLLLLATAIAVLLMGHHGTMLGRIVSPLGCGLSYGIMAWAMVVTLVSLVQVFWTGAKLRQYAEVTLTSGEPARMLETPVPMAAQIGIWRSSLLVSRGWVEQLSALEQQAMLHHEQAHAHYRDVLWFLVLGMVRRFTCWLPRTEALWQELVLLREIRADHWAAQRTDALMLAELLVKVSRQLALEPHFQGCSAIGFSGDYYLNRLEQRVDALLQANLNPDRATPGFVDWVALLLTGIPLLALWLHT